MSEFQAKVTGLLLAGGAGRRMGGVDKGLQMLDGRPLAVHVLERIRPQVSEVLISANRHRDRYAALGHRVLADSRFDDALNDPSEVPLESQFGSQFEAQFNGPLAGMLAGLRACTGDWLQCVPCDTPHLPLDLCQRLAAALAPETLAAWPRTQDGGSWRSQPTFALLHRSLLPSLQDYLAAGERRVEGWLRQEAHVQVDFAHPGDTEAFANLNTLADLNPLP